MYEPQRPNVCQECCKNFGVFLVCLMLFIIVPVIYFLAMIIGYSIFVIPTWMALTFVLLRKCFIWIPERSSPKFNL